MNACFFVGGLSLETGVSEGDYGKPKLTKVY